MSIAAVLTAYYMSRLIFMTFFGEARWDEAPRGSPSTCHPHESPVIMTVPLWCSLPSRR